MTRTLASVLLPLSLLLAGCCNEQRREVVIVPTCNADGGVPDVGTAEPFEADQSAEAVGGVTPCARACKRFSELGCPEALKLPGGKTCVQTCKDISSISSFSPVCVIAAKDVESVRKCPETRCLQQK